MESETYEKIVQESNKIMQELNACSIDEAIKILKEREAKAK